MNPFRINNKPAEVVAFPVPERAGSGTIKRLEHHCEPPTRKECDALKLKPGDMWICDCGEEKKYYGGGVW